MDLKPCIAFVIMQKSFLCFTVLAVHNKYYKTNTDIFSYNIPSTVLMT